MVEVEPGVSVQVRKYPNDQANFSLLYFHGNGEIASDYDNMAPLFLNLGCDFLVGEFRGYGKSNGSPSLRRCLEDSRTIFTYLKAEGKLKPHVAVMGRSLGSAPAIELAANFDDIERCVIESGYADPILLAERRGIRIDNMTDEENTLFNNSQKLASIRCPLLIMHGREDCIIQPHEAQINFDSAGTEKKYLQYFDGVGHNDILFAPDNGYFSALSEFFQAT